MIDNVRNVAVTLATLVIFVTFVYYVARVFPTVLQLVVDTINQMKIKFGEGDYKGSILMLAILAGGVLGIVLVLEVVFVLFDVTSIASSGQGTVDWVKAFFRSAGWQ